MNKITRYHNTINTIPMRQWTAEEQNFFFALLTQVRDKGAELIKFDKYQLKEFADYTNRHHADFRQTMKNLASKLINLNYLEETSKSFKIMTLFSTFEINWENDLSDMILEIQISPNFEYVVNQINANFTQFELEQFTNLRSTYAKTMFRHLKQWRTKGVIGGFNNGEIPKEELFIMLGVPKSMQRPNNFNAKVLKPILDELSPLFEGLKVKPIKARKAGNPIIAYKFSWKQEQTQSWIDGKYEKEKSVIPIPAWSKQDYKENTSPEETAKFEAYKKIKKTRQEEQTTFDFGEEK